MTKITKYLKSIIELCQAIPIVIKITTAVVGAFFGGLQALSAPIANVLGGFLSFVFGATLVVSCLTVCIICVKEFLLLKNSGKKVEKLDVQKIKEELSKAVNEINKISSGSDILNKILDDYDIGQLADAEFDKKTLKFTYRTPKKIPIFSGQKKWVFKERLLLPKLSKSIQIGFEVRNTHTGEEVEFKAFIVIGNDSKEVDSITKECSYDLPPDREINFYFKGIEEKTYDCKSLLLIKSITFNKSP